MNQRIFIQIPYFRYYRRAAAFMGLGKFKNALSDFEYVSCKSLILNSARLQFHHLIGC